jgi:hypothetical protein
VLCSTSFAAITPGASASKSIVDLIGRPTGGDLGGLFRAPRGPAINQGGNGAPAGTSYVLDADNARIQRFSPTGEFEFAWGFGVRDGEEEFEICKVASLCSKGNPGSEAGQLGSESQGIAIDQGSGDVYVSDQANRRIDVFTPAGIFVGAFGWGVRKDDDESAGLDFCTTPSGCQTGFLGEAAGQFQAELGNLTVDESGKIYVADKGNRRVDIFKPILGGGVVVGVEFLRAFGWGVDTGANAFEICTVASTCNAGSTEGSGSDAGRFSTQAPSDVAVDSQGNVFVLDVLVGRVQEFNSTPEVLDSHFGSAALVEAFNSGNLLNIAVADDHLYVSGTRSDSEGRVAVAELDHSGALLDMHGTDLVGTSAFGVATARGSLGGSIYVPTGSDVSGVYILNDRPTMDPVTSHAGTTATFSGAVVSNGIPTTYHFEYSPDSEHWSSFPSSDVSAGISTAIGQIASTGAGSGTLTVAAAGGTFILSFNGESTPTLTHDSSAVSVQTALESITSVGAGNVEVSGGPGDPEGSTPYTISFTGALSGTEVTQIGIDATDLDAPLIPVAQNATGLTGSQAYLVRLVQNRAAGGGRVASTPVMFVTDPAAPAISDTHASQPTDTGVTLNATLNRQNEDTSYRFEYVDDAEFMESGFANAISFPASGATVGSGGAVTIAKDVDGLEPATMYHFRMIASNATGSTVGEEATFTTYPDQEVEQDCKNAQFRSGPSAHLPDCRAYELVTPVDSNGSFPFSIIGESAQRSAFDTALATADGGSVIFGTQGTLPGDEENGGARAAYEARRLSTGWETHGIGPDGAQAAAPGAGGVSWDHGYAFWQTGEIGGSLMVGGEDARYIRNPDGSFELIGQGALGVDPKAWGRWIAAGASHMIFSTEPGIAVPLESGAPPAGTAAIYDRTLDGTTHVVSLRPDGTPFSGGENAEYKGASADGSAVVFKVGPTYYERRDNAITVPIVTGNLVRFGGISQNGDQVIYTNGPSATSQNIFIFDADTQVTTQIVTGGRNPIVSVSADGSHVYFTSKLQIGGEGIAGENNLFVWDGSTVRFIAVLAPEDLVAFGTSQVKLGRWVEILNLNPSVQTGPANNPSRTTPDGKVFVFQSHANLTSYDSSGHGEIYRYDSTSQDIACISCSPLGLPATSEARFQANTVTDINPPTNALSHIDGVTNDGNTVFFQTGDSLVPKDVNGKQDVYEWRSGRVFLVSSGRSSSGNYLYAMTPDGNDVFFTTNEALVPGDQNGGSRRIYDARIEGGFPSSTEAEQCLEDACQGQPSLPPALLGAGSAAFQGPGTVKQRHHRGHPRKKHRHKHRHHKHRRHRAGGNHGGSK